MPSKKDIFNKILKEESLKNKGDLKGKVDMETIKRVESRIKGLKQDSGFFGHMDPSKIKRTKIRGGCA